jgi:hypothetical protein
MLTIKTSHYGKQFNHLSSEALKLIKHRELKTRTLEELLRFAKLLKQRANR